MEMLDPLKLNSTGKAREFTGVKRFVWIGLVITFVLLFILNLVTWAPAVVLGNPGFQIPGKYFYWDHGVVYEVTRESYIWSNILFFSGITLFLVVFVGSLILHATGRGNSCSQPKRISRGAKWLFIAFFVVFAAVIGTMTYRAHKEWATYPNPAASASEFVLNVRGATEVFFDEYGRYATTTDEFMNTGHFHPSSVDILKGIATLEDYTFTYTSDGKSYECIGQPPPSSPHAYVYFVSSESWFFYCLFQDTDLDQLKQAISKRK
jgi:hypothetical protein